MSPRLLRPRQAGGFDPRSIAGCVCNLDASVLSSLFQSSDGTTAATATDDPVAYWGDLSGSSSHAKQTVATGSRPLLKLNNQNGRPGLLFDGSNDFLAATIAGLQSMTGLTVIQILKTASAAAADTNTAVFCGFGNVSNSGGSFPANKGIGIGSSTGIAAGERIMIFAEPTVTGTFGRYGSSAYSRAANTAQVLACTFGSAGVTIRQNTTSVAVNVTVNPDATFSPQATGYTVDNDMTIAAYRVNGSLIYSPQITIHQHIVYSRQLTAAEQDTIALAMMAKWGIT